MSRSSYNGRPSLRAFVMIVLIACATLAVAIWASSQARGSVSSRAHAARASDARQSYTSKPPAALAGVRGRVLKAGEMKGFSPQGRRLLVSSAIKWVYSGQEWGSQGATEVASLKRGGFVAALSENLMSSGGTPGVSIVEQFRSARGARADLSANLKQQRILSGSPPTLKPFAVPGIPGARGFGYSGSLAANVAFAKGDYYYLVGSDGTASGSGAGRATVIAAAQHLYHRVKP